jgi:hypothetical protein
LEEKKLSYPRREMLVKNVLYALPTYFSQCIRCLNRASPRLIDLGGVFSREGRILTRLKEVTV